MHSGLASGAGRKISLLASGSAAEAKVLYVDETGMHSQGEHVLAEIDKKGSQVQLVRCGPVYTSSTSKNI